MTPYAGTVDYLEAYNVACDEGYTVSGAAEMSCLSTETLSVTHTCDSKYLSHEIVFPVTFITPASRRFQGTFYQSSSLRHRLQFLSKCAP